jgi:hypothetical protein
MDDLIAERIRALDDHLRKNVSRDNLDENGRRQSEFEAAAGSEVMIDLSREVRK